jgi:hypothetical protein
MGIHQSIHELRHTQSILMEDVLVEGTNRKLATFEFY